VRGALGLAAVGGDEVQLRLVVLAPLLLTPGDEGDAVAAPAEGRLRVLLARPG
jgi:hypothetical protein